jgi:hypothetical protein
VKALTEREVHDVKTEVHRLKNSLKDEVGQRACDTSLEEP